jgi:hypothetical protein
LIQWRATHLKNLLRTYSAKMAEALKGYCTPACRLHLPILRAQGDRAGHVQFHAARTGRAKHIQTEIDGLRL